MKISKTQITIETYRETISLHISGACPTCGHERQPATETDVITQDKLTTITTANNCNGHEILNVNTRGELRCTSNIG